MTQIHKTMIAKFLTFVLCMNIILVPTAYASEPQNGMSTLFSESGTTETLTIDGVNYTYNRFLRNGDHVTIITNDANSTIEEIVFDVDSSVLYYNGAKVAVIPYFSTDDPVCTLRFTWRTITKDDIRITWAQGLTAAGLAELIASTVSNRLGSLGYLKASKVVDLMGDALSTLATSCIGATISVELQMLTVPASLNQYRYIWKFTASSGESYGPYISDVYF